MTGYLLATVVTLVIEVIILRFADSKKARKLVFDAFLAVFAAIWSIYEIAKINFTIQMVIAVVIIGLGIAAVINFIRDLIK
ncbi:MAG: hypothetical protein J6J36_04910 [Clostridia bacterium]|nr:hypothetical protein [Clostridia bacterium]